MKNSKYKILLPLILAVLFLAIFLLFLHKTDILKIFVVYYKPAPIIRTDIFEPIQGGRAIADTPSRKGSFSSEEISWLNSHMIGDNTGENISHLNRCFSELTALYWIWKNTKTPLVGMFHYRRFLSLNDNSHYPMVMFPSMRFRHLGIKHLASFSNEFLTDLALEKKTIISLLNTYDIIVSEPIKLNSYEQYKEEHIISDLDDALEIIRQKHPNMYDFAIKTLNSEDGFYPTNMFITHRKTLNNYAEWLFSILLPLYENKKEEFNKRDTEQKLACAYLAERLFTVYLRYEQTYHNLRIKEVPHALASDFFTPPGGSAYIILKTPDWEDIFIDQQDNKLCSFNNPYKNCGKYTFYPEGKIQIIWDDGETSYFRHSQDNIFTLEK